MHCFPIWRAVNEEGAAISPEAGRPTVGVPFTEESRERLRTEPRLGPRRDLRSRHSHTPHPVRCHRPESRKWQRKYN
jgi:hypothetical protein